MFKRLYEYYKYIRFLYHQNKEFDCKTLNSAAIIEITYIEWKPWLL